MILLKFKSGGEYRINYNDGGKTDQEILVAFGTAFQKDKLAIAFRNIIVNLSDVSYVEIIKEPAE